MVPSNWFYERVCNRLGESNFTSSVGEALGALGDQVPTVQTSKPSLPHIGGTGQVANSVRETGKFLTLL